jgi:hypothetical protein
MTDGVSQNACETGVIIVDQQVHGGSEAQLTILPPALAHYFTCRLREPAGAEAQILQVLAAGLSRFG